MKKSKWKKLKEYVEKELEPRRERDYGKDRHGSVGFGVKRGFEKVSAKMRELERKENDKG